MHLQTYVWHFPCSSTGTGCTYSFCRQTQATFMHIVLKSFCTQELLGQVASIRLVHTCWEGHAMVEADWCKTGLIYLCPVQVFDNLSLGEWVHALRRQGKNQMLSAWKRECLEMVHFVWNVDHQTASWHYHLHEARRYKVMSCTVS